jgi:hypothetical protein
MKTTGHTANLRAIYEQIEFQKRLLEGCISADAEAAELLRKSGPDWLIERAEDAAARGDPEEILMLLDNTRELVFVADNMAWLHTLGKYEVCLAEAFIDTRTNYAHWTLAALKRLFAIADRDRLRAAGDPLPPGETFTLYRGVAGAGKMRRPSGPSWTADMERAKWFALRVPNLQCRAVYTATVRREDVLFYSNEREEKEYVCFVPRPKRLKIELAAEL